MRRAIFRSPPTKSLRVAGNADPSSLPVLGRRASTDEYRQSQPALAAGRLGAAARSAICREALKTAVAALFVVATIGLAFGCGGGAGNGKKTWKDKPVVAKTKKKARGDDEDESSFKKNPRWELVRAHFEKFARRPISMHKDIFKSHLDKYVEKIEIAQDAATDEEQEAAVVTKKEEELDPLKKFPADEYRVRIIMTGTARPKALLADPKGNAYEVFVDTEVGNENGVVESITQYEIVVRQPNEQKPVRLEAKPQVFDISKRQEKKRDKLEGTDEQY